ncbi:MAG: choice-of-anchor D domain-containing protein [Terriglobia bacterium]
MGWLTVLGVGSGAAQNCFTVSPSNLSIQFAKQAVGTTSSTMSGVIITNNCTTNLQITSITLSPSEFPLGMGYAPWTIQPSQKLEYGIRFAPDSAQVFNGQFTIGLQGYSPVVITLTGTGFVSGAVANLSAMSLSFANVPVGRTSPVQTVNLTNLGTGPMTVESVYTEPPFSVIGYTGGTKGTVLQPNQALPLKVAFSPSIAGSYPGTLVITTDSFPPMGTTLNGTATDATSLSITNFPTLASGTQGAAYLAVLTAAGGVGGLTWSLPTGSKLPKGVTLSSSGALSGTFPSTLKVGNYRFKATVTDSNSPPDMATTSFVLPIGAPTGATCSNISWNIAGTNNPIVPITDLGTGTYLGAEGGLYLNGSNVMPASHDSDGVGLAQSIQPLDSNGNPDPNGKYALLSLGLSITFENYFELQQAGTADPSLNPHLVLVNGANPNLTAARYANPNDAIWATIMNYFLPQSGVTANQVVAAWVMVIDGFPTGTFPGDISTLETQYISIAQNLHTKFPNLEVAFFSSRDYSGYSNGEKQPDDPEPYAYEDGFAVQAVIQDQLNGDPALNYNPANGTVMAPWLAWADYDWANGLLPRSDGLAWGCQDFLYDGTHNSDPSGREKDANILLNFLKTDDATAPWFLAAPPRRKQ